MLFREEGVEEDREDRLYKGRSSVPGPPTLDHKRELQEVRVEQFQMKTEQVIHLIKAICLLEKFGFENMAERSNLELRRAVEELNAELERREHVPG